MKYVQTGKLPPDDQAEYRTERAAIYEYDGGLSPEEAEKRSILEKPCRCGGKKYWASVNGPIICFSCHPPAAERLIKRIIEVELPEAEE